LKQASYILGANMNKRERESYRMSVLRYSLLLTPAVSNG